MGDDASTKMISKRLRESCSTIFTNDDALVVKVYNLTFGFCK